MRGCSFFTAGSKRPTLNAQRPTPNYDLTSRLSVRRWAFGVFLHPFRHFDPEKIETALQNSPGEIAQCQTRAARGFFRFQDRTGFVKCVKAVRQLEQIICQNVRAKIVQHLWDYFRELTKTLCEINFGTIIEDQFATAGVCVAAATAGLADLWCGFVGFAKNGTNSHISVLQIWRRVSLQGEHLLPRKNIICHPVLREIEVLDRADPDLVRDVRLVCFTQIWILLLDNFAGALAGFLV